MKPPVPPSRQLEQLFQDLEDGVISASDHARLMSLMDAHYEVRRRYRKHMGFISALQAEADAHAKIRGGIGNFVPETSARGFARSLLAAAALIALLAVAAMFIYAPVPAPATVSAGDGTSWRFVSGGISKNRDFEPGTRVSVETGTLELTASDGTRVLLEGPADFEWRSRLSTRLRSGQAWFAVVPKDVGFTVELDRMHVEDLGTEFGIRVLPGEEQVHVGAGKVRVKPRRGDLAARDLEAGMAVANDLIGRLREIPCDPERFHRQVAAAPDFIRWSFEGTDENGFRAQVRGIPAHPLRLLTPDGRPAERVRSSAGPFGNAVDLQASGAYLRADYEGVLGAAPRSVSFWMRAKQPPPLVPQDGQIFIPSVLSWGMVAGGTKWHITVGPDGKGFSTLWGDSWTTAGVRDDSLLDGRWHHIVSVFTGRHDEGGVPEIHHYLDGEKISNTGGLVLGPVNTRSNPANPQFFSIGLVEPPGRARSILPLLIDEVLVTRAALDAETVRRLYETNELAFPPARELKEPDGR